MAPCESSKCEKEIENSDKLLSSTSYGNIWLCVALHIWVCPFTVKYDYCIVLDDLQILYKF